MTRQEDGIHNGKFLKSKFLIGGFWNFLKKNTQKKQTTEKKEIKHNLENKIESYDR